MIRLPYQVSERFQLIDLLGSGNWSEVFLARDHQPDTGPELVAFKLFKSLQRAEGREFEQSLSTFEFQILSRLRHPNLAMVYDYGTDPGTGRSFFTMERLTGCDFLEAVSGMAPLETIPLMVDTCRALHHIHTMGLIHHDLKPGNLIVNSTSMDGRPLPKPLVKLTDFGLSTTIDQAADGYLRGTPEFMAPEMLAGREKDHRCDLYSLGVLLYLGLSGRLPYPEGRRPGTEDIPPPSLRGRNNEPVPAFLEDLVDRLLEANPADRYQTANEVIRDLGLYTGTEFDLEPGAVGASSAAAETILTVTREQLEDLHRTLKRLGDGNGRHRPALVTGGPGSGKKHLLLELRRHAQTAGAQFVYCPAGTNDLAGWSVQHRGQRRTGLVLALNADEQNPTAVLRLLQMLTLKKGEEGIFALVTATAGLPGTLQLLESLGSDDDVEIIHLQPLTPELTARFLSRLLGSQIDVTDPLTNCVMAESSGIPLLVEETVAHLQATRALTLPRSGPSFDPARHLVDFTPPAGHLLDHHRPTAAIASTPSLRALAVLGAPATAQLVAAVVGGQCDSDTVVRQLEDNRNLLEIFPSDHGPAFSFRSLFTRNLVHDQMDDRERRELHRRAAEAFQHDHPSPGIEAGSLIWRHLMLSGAVDQAWETGLHRGQGLEQLNRWKEADEIYTTLLDHGGVDHVSPGIAVDLCLRSANLKRASGQSASAQALLEEGLRIAEAAELREQIASFKLGAGNLLEKKGDLEPARRLYEQGIQDLSEQGGEIHGKLHLRLGLNALQSGRPDDAERHLDHCRKILGQSPSEDGNESCLLLESLLSRHRQKLQPAIQRLERWLESGGRSSTSVTTGRLLVLLGEMYCQQYKFEQADRYFSASMEIFKQHGERTLEAISLANLGALHFEQGRFSSASRFNLDCLRAHEKMGTRYGQAVSQYNLGVCDFHRGRYEEALDHLRAARGIYEYIGDHQGLAQCINMEAELCLTVGDNGRTAELLQAGAAALPAGDPGYSAADRLLLEAELTLTADGPKAAENISYRARDFFASLGDTRQLARTDLLLSRCQAAAGQWKDAEKTLTTARVIAESIKSPRLQAEVVLVSSELRLHFGLGPTHEDCATFSTELLEQMSKVEDPDFRQALFSALGRHREALGQHQEAVEAFHHAFDLLRQVAARFSSRRADWKSAYLSAELRADVVRRMAAWSGKKKEGEDSRNQ